MLLVYLTIQLFIDLDPGETTTPKTTSDCCNQLQLNLEGGPDTYLNPLEAGTYHYDGELNGKEYWSNGQYGIWFTSNGYWVMNSMDKLGESSGFVFGLSHSCPKDINWNKWSYFDQTAIVDALEGEITWECLGIQINLMTLYYN